ncbi:AAA domain (dynein-related subfamily) [Novymonas esmeraldas]|uniref:AAA domain (Dynein-related subfamily) n=1 Tax=Novymonas esmeraldas TaxID=1808958 RepID=A0AAW0ESZ1_9TRYP
MPAAGEARVRPAVKVRPVSVRGVTLKMQSTDFGSSTAAASISRPSAPKVCADVRASAESSDRGDAVEQTLKAKHGSWKAYTKALESRLPEWTDEAVRNEVSRIREKVKRIMNSVCSAFLKREEAVGVCLMATLCHQHAFLYSAPGEAKTQLVELTMKHLSATDFDAEAKSVDITFDVSTEVEDVAGFKSMVDYKHDRIRYIRDHTLCGDHTYFAFIDEIWKARGPTLQVLLNLTNERVFKKEGRLIALPLFSLFCASNELPMGAGLQAVFDRILFRTFIHAPRTEDFLQWIRSRGSASSNAEKGVKEQLTIGEVGFLHAVRNSAKPSTEDWLRPTTPAPGRVRDMFAAIVAFTDTFGEMIRDTENLDVRGGHVMTTRRKNVLWTAIEQLSTFYGRPPHPFDLLLFLNVGWRRHSEIARVRTFVVTLLRRALARDVAKEDHKAELDTLDGCFLLPSDVIAAVKEEWTSSDEEGYSEPKLDELKTAELRRANDEMADRLRKENDLQHEEQRARDLKRQKEYDEARQKFDESTRSNEHQLTVERLKEEQQQKKLAAETHMLELRKTQEKTRTELEAAEKARRAVEEVENERRAQEAEAQMRREEATEELRALLNKIGKQEETTDENLEEVKQVMERQPYINKMHGGGFNETILPYIMHRRLDKVLRVVLDVHLKRTSDIIDLDLTNNRNYTVLCHVFLDTTKRSCQNCNQMIEILVTFMKAYPDRFKCSWCGWGENNHPGGFLRTVIKQRFFDSMKDALFSLPYFEDSTFLDVELPLYSYNALAPNIKRKFDEAKCRKP